MKQTLNIALILAAIIAVILVAATKVDQYLALVEFQSTSEAIAGCATQATTTTTTTEGNRQIVNTEPITVLYDKCLQLKGIN
jgi:hypothetical protein